MPEFFSLDSVYRNKIEKRFTQKLLKSRGASTQKIVQMIDSEENLVIASKSKIVEYCLDSIKKNSLLNNHLESISKEYFVGSIAYVFKAKLKNNDKYIAIKILRENIEEKIKSDFEKSAFLTKSVNNLFQSEKFENLEVFASSFIKDMILECNLIDEEKNYQQFKTQLKNNDEIGVPHLYNQYTSKEIICYEWIEATHTTNMYPTIDSRTKKKLSKELNKVFVVNALSNGFIQEDSNPANFILKQDKLYFIDFGKIYKLPLNFRIAMCYFIHKLQTTDKVDFSYHYSLLGYDKKSLTILNDYLPMITEILFAPYLTNHLTVEAWNPTKKLSILLGDLKWVLRSAGGITNFKFTRSLLGLYKTLNLLDANISTKEIIEPVIDLYKADFERLEENNKNPNFSYNLNFDQRKISITIKKKSNKETKVVLPVNVLYSISDFLSDETLKSIEDEGLNIPEIIQRAFSSKEYNYKLINIRNKKGDFKIDIIS